MSWQATSGRMPMGAQHGRGRFIRPNRASSPNMMRKRRHAWRQPVELSSRHWENRFFKSVLSRNVAFGMEWTRHQLAPAMPGQKIVDRAVAGRVPDGLFVGCLEIVDVQHFASPGGLGKTPQQGLFLSQRHVLAFAPPARLRLESFDAAVVVGHVRPVHRAQRNPHCIRNRRLRHPAFTQQYHLNALPLSLGHFPMQCRLQLPNLAFRAFDHPSLPKQMATGNHTISLAGGTELPQTRRFNQLWKWYQQSYAAKRCASIASSSTAPPSKKRS